MISPDELADRLSRLQAQMAEDTVDLKQDKVAWSEIPGPL
jgi:hypothetical protein